MIVQHLEILDNVHCHLQNDFTSLECKIGWTAYFVVAQCAFRKLLNGRTKFINSTYVAQYKLIHPPFRVMYIHTYIQMSSHSLIIRFAVQEWDEFRVELYIALEIL